MHTYYCVLFVSVTTITITLFREMSTLAIVNIECALLLLHYLIECINL